MTSQSDLPIAEFGMIWDKETEFAQLIPGHVGLYYAVSLATDGSRRVLDGLGVIRTCYSCIPSRHKPWMGSLSGWPRRGSYTGELLCLRWHRKSHEPVNQIPYLRSLP